MFTAIKGTFHVVGYSPDGDSIRFKAHNKNNWQKVNGYKLRLNKKDHAQLRIEAIDTLETHYKGKHQPSSNADAATTKLFEILGINNVVWYPSHYKVKSADDGVEGYILTRFVERYGRPVSFVYGNSLNLEDGQEVRIDDVIAKQSVNYQMLLSGYAYPTFYDGLFYDLRELFANAVQIARKINNGIWKLDQTNKFFKVENMESITDDNVILPKLFRRICAFIKANGTFNTNDFLKYVKQKNEKVFILSQLHFTHFDNLISKGENGQIKINEKPENLIFIG